MQTLALNPTGPQTTTYLSTSKLTKKSIPMASPLVQIREKLSNLKSGREKCLSTISQLLTEKNEIDDVLPILISNLLDCHENVQTLHGEREIYETAIKDMEEAYGLVCLEDGEGLNEAIEALGQYADEQDGEDDRFDNDNDNDNEDNNGDFRNSNVTDEGNEAFWENQRDFMKAHGMNHEPTMADIEML